MQTFDGFLKALFEKRGNRGSLDVLTKCSVLFGAPHTDFPTIHIAGTNGKGSVAHMMAKSLELGGFRCGLFTSPHISTYLERIQIGGRPIAEKELMHFYTLITYAQKQLGVELKFFETTTLLAFLAFSHYGVDVAVMETGIGGRLDPTNICHPCLTIITSIGLDHTHILGHDIEQIAQEKAGIIKKGVDLVIGPHADLSPIRKTANEMQSACFVAPSDPSFVEENRAIARLGLKRLENKFFLSQQHIEKGLNTPIPGRLERLEMQGRQVIFDGAHNFAACQRLSQELDGRHIALFAMSCQKDAGACIDALRSKVDHFYLIQIDATNGMSVDSLEKICLEKKVSYKKYSTIDQAVAEALQHTKILHTKILVVGSFYLLAPTKALLRDLLYKKKKGTESSIGFDLKGKEPALI